MYIYRSTQVPNEIFDQWLPHLNQAQIKVLMIVIRQTLGWIDPKTKKRKRKDWISIPFFTKRTGLTRKSVSIAISKLVYKELIVALDSRENELRHPKDRRGKKRIYYAYAPYFRALKRKTWVDMVSEVFTFRPYTKQTPTKEKERFDNSAYLRQTDTERYRELINNNKPPPNYR